MATDSLQRSLDLLRLTMLSRRPRLHGHAIMGSYARASGDVLWAEEGSLCPALDRIEEAGLMCTEWVKKDTCRQARVSEAGFPWRAVSLAMNRVLREA